MPTSLPKNGLEDSAAHRVSPLARIPDFSGITFDESRRLLRIMWGAAHVIRHYDFLVWLNGEVQQFVPHQLLIAAWGRLVKGEFQCDVTSTLPGVRTASMASCRDPGFVRGCYARWIAARRHPLLLTATDAAALARLTCGCPVHLALRRTRLLLIHAIRDERADEENLYIALRLNVSIDRCGGMLDYLVEPLFVQIDAAFRRVASSYRHAPGSPSVSWLPHMSKREEEILNWLCQGKRTADIAGLLGISPFTVRNHVQHIFRKMSVTNRAEAAAKYSLAAQDVRRGLDRASVDESPGARSRATSPLPVPRP